MAFTLANFFGARNISLVGIYILKGAFWISIKFASHYFIAHDFETNDFPIHGFIAGKITNFNLFSWEKFCVLLQRKTRE
jgi:hypothetical protein